MLARWAGQRYRVLVLEDPTIGVDFGAKAEIYRMMAEDAAAGTAAIVVSSDLDELVQICRPGARLQPRPDRRRADRARS